jgi:gamma-glutamyl hercynylcysteine S-oxide synthase
MANALQLAVTHPLLERLWDGRRQTDELFKIVTADALYERPIPERHRIVFYIGHLEAFDTNLLRERLLGVRQFNPELDKLFAFGIDPVDGGLPSDQPRDWPAMDQVHRYVVETRERLDDDLSQLEITDLHSSQGPDVSPATLLNVAIEHRLMHAETLAYMFHQLPYKSKIAPVKDSALHPDSLPPLRSRMIEIPAGPATLGLSRRAPEAFGWDNEFEEKTENVPAFAIENHKVTNGQYLDFVNGGGYQSRELWSAADWEWRSAGDITAPIFWEKIDGCWHFKTMFRAVALAGPVIDWPVYVSHAEASAYARWAGKALPSEAQWHRATYGTHEGVERPYPWGSESPDLHKGNFDFASWDPVPVGNFPEGASAFEVHDLLGNGWEWTSSEFKPFPGFREFSFYPGYSANFFDGKHFVMKGGSARTAASMLRRSFRNWFQPHYQYVYAGFRCVSN